MTIRFFILQAHYRSTVDFSNEALQASEKGLQRLMEAYERLGKLTASAASTVDVKGLREKCDEAMNDDLNSPIAISHLFDACKAINSISDGKATISAEDLEELKSVFKLSACKSVSVVTHFIKRFSINIPLISFSIHTHP